MSAKPLDPSDRPTLTRDVGDGDTLARPSSPHSSLAPGQTFGPYLIHRLLGKGGMGEVYEAEQRESGRRVALKVLADPDPLPEARERFLREGRLAAAVNHPNSVYIYGTEEIEGQWAISMELLAGGSLKDRMREKGPLPPQEAVDAILQVIDGLEAAASAGVLHRDVKPANCFVELDGTVKIGDFGLSLSTLARDRSRSHLTRSGTLVGTPAFASPEQLRGDDLDVRSDIYSVGATLYYLLTGRAPFEADNLMQVLTTIAEKPPESPRRLNPKIPRGLAKTVLQCLIKKPGGRPGDYAALRQSLESFGPPAVAPEAWALHPLAVIVNCALIWAVSAAALGLFGVAAGRPARGFEAAVACAFSAILVLSPMLFTGNEPMGERLLGLRVLETLGSEAHIVIRANRFLASVTLAAIAALALRQGEFRLVFECLVFQTGLLFPLDLRPVRRGGARARAAIRPVTPNVISGHSIGPFQLFGEPERGPSFIRAFDPLLRRTVWVARTGDGQLPQTPVRATRLRRISAGADPAGHWVAFEAPDGEVLARTNPRPWSSARLLARDLAIELSAGFADGSLPAGLSLDHIFVSEPHAIRLLELAAPGAAGGRRVRATEGSERDVLRFLADAIRRMVALPGDPIFLPRNASRYLEDLDAGVISSLRDAALMGKLLARDGVDGAGRMFRHPTVLLTMYVFLFSDSATDRPGLVPGILIVLLASARVISTVSRSRGSGPKPDLGFGDQRHLLKLDGSAAGPKLVLWREALEGIPLLVAVLVALSVPEYRWIALGLAATLVIAQVRGSSLDGRGPLGRLTGTLWVPSHLPFGDPFMGPRVNVYEFLRDTLLTDEFRAIDPKNEGDWRQLGWAVERVSRERARWAA